MAIRHGSPIREVVDWGAGERRRRRLEAELERIVTALPGLGVRRAILFGSLARGDVGAQSDLDLILIVDSQARFPERCRRFYETLEPRVGMDILVYTPDEFEAIAPRPPSPSLPHVRPSSRTRASTASRRPRKRSRHFSTLGAPNTSWDIRSRISPPNARSSTRRSCRSRRGRRPSTSFTCPRATRTPCRAVCLLTRLPARTPSARSTWPAR